MGQAGILGDASIGSSFRNLAAATMAEVKGGLGGQEVVFKEGVCDLPLGPSHTCGVCWASGFSCPSEDSWACVGHTGKPVSLSGGKDIGDF